MTGESAGVVFTIGAMLIYIEFAFPKFARLNLMSIFGVTGQSVGRYVRLVVAVGLMLFALGAVGTIPRHLAAVFGIGWGLALLVALGIEMAQGSGEAINETTPTVRGRIKKNVGKLNNPSPNRRVTASKANV